MKICSNKQCSEKNPQPIDNFSLRSDRPGKRLSRCIECERERGRLKYQKYKNRYLAKNKEWSINNPDKIAKIKKKYRSNEKVAQKEKEYGIIYRNINKTYFKHKAAERRAQKLKATPKWANMDKIKEIYKNCPEGYHVDHVIPLNNPIVCGLHVENNLQYLPASENLKKSNKLGEKYGSGL